MVAKSNRKSSMKIYEVKGMKRLLALLLSMVLVLGFAVGCNNEKDDGGTPGGTGDGGNQNLPGGNVDVPHNPDLEDLKVWSFTNEIPDAILRYQEMNPDSQVNNFNIIRHVVSDQDGLYEQAIEPALLAGGDNAPDLFMAEQAFVLKFVSGSFSGYAMSYSDLGISDVEGKIKAAQLADYAVDAGRRDGEVVGLRFQETGSCFIYRRSIAKDVWGTDTPADIGAKVGSGWDNFMAAAADLKAKGYAIIYGPGDVWQVARDGAAEGWVKDGRLVIDPARLQFFELAKTLNDNEYWLGGGAWSDGWFAGMSGASDPAVFGYMGPAWLINYVIADNCGIEIDEETDEITDMGTFGDWAVTGSPVPWAWGGTWLFGHKDLEGDKKAAVAEILEWVTLDTTNDGFQYHFANGSLYAGSTRFADEAKKFEDGTFTKDTVASKVVMDKSDGSLDFLGGQNMFEEFIPAAAGAKSTHWHELDRSINGEFQDQAVQYYTGAKTLEEALEDFRTWAKDTHGLD